MSTGADPSARRIGKLFRGLGNSIKFVGKTAKNLIRRSEAVSNAVDEAVQEASDVANAILDEKGVGASSKAEALEAAIAAAEERAAIKIQIAYRKHSKMDGNSNLNIVEMKQAEKEAKAEARKVVQETLEKNFEKAASKKLVKKVRVIKVMKRVLKKKAADESHQPSVSTSNAEVLTANVKQGEDGTAREGDALIISRDAQCTQAPLNISARESSFTSDSLKKLSPPSPPHSVEDYPVDEGKCTDKDSLSDIPGLTLFIDKMHRINDEYFGKDKEVRLVEGIMKALNALDVVEKDLISSASDGQLNESIAAEIKYLRGKTLDSDVRPNATAVEQLKECISICPNFVPAYSVLANAEWKSGDLSSAHEHLIKRIELEREGREEIGGRSLVDVWVQLSMLERAMAARGMEGVPRASSGKNLIELSVEHAKTAVVSDISSAKAWCCLGNAHMAEFFHSSAGRHINKIFEALKAYKRSDALLQTNGGILPDLHYNRAVALRFVERYDEAMERFREAASIDEQLQAQNEVEKTTAFVSNLCRLTKHNGYMKPKRIEKFLSDCAAVQIDGLEAVLLGGLSESEKEGPTGSNCGKVLTGKILHVIAVPHSLPQVYLCMDRSGAVWFLNLYTSRDYLRDNTVVHVLEPRLRQHNGFTSISIDNPKQMRIS